MKWILVIILAFFLLFVLIHQKNPEGKPRSAKFKNKLFGTSTTTTPAPIPDLCQELPGSYVFPSDGLPIWDQKSSGACWACAIADAVMYEAKRKYPNEALIPLSIQQLRECVREPPLPTDEKADVKKPKGNHMSWALAYIHEYGLQTNESYEFTEDKGNCSAERDLFRFRAEKFRKFQGKEVLRECSKKTIVIAAVNADNSQMKKNQIIDHKCPNIAKARNHYIIIVGEVIHPKTRELVWKFRNSYGSSWGENGYGFISQKVENPICLYDEMYVIDVKRLRQN